MWRHLGETAQEIWEIPRGQIVSMILGPVEEIASEYLYVLVAANDVVAHIDWMYGIYQTWTGTHFHANLYLPPEYWQFYRDKINYEQNQYNLLKELASLSFEVWNMAHAEQRSFSNTMLETISVMISELMLLKAKKKMMERQNRTEDPNYSTLVTYLNFSEFVTKHLLATYAAQNHV
uniref:Uncharacterized protein n=1 Tax=Anopheles coluzzii TaxID=1518534 RepID=A0A8W7PFP2_ANOCL